MRRKYFFLYTFILLFATALQADPVLENRMGLYYRIYEKPPYRFLYLLNKPAVKKLSSEIEIFHNEYYGRLFGTEKLPAVEIVIFTGEKQYLTRTGLPRGYRAHYLPEKKMIVTYAKQDAGVVFHEIVHHWIQSNIRGNIRLWFEEGLASLFESPVKTNNGFIFFKTNERQLKLKGKWTDLDAFMNTVDLPHEHDKAQARLIFLWLAENNLLEKYLKAYSDNLDFDFSGIDAMEEVTGKPLSELNTILKSYSEKVQ